MKIIDKALLAEFREPGRCEWCGTSCRLREPHHLWAKGMGGGGRLDIRCNLIALGSSLNMACPCHGDVHDGRITREDLLAKVAAREGCFQDDIEAVVCLLRCLIKPSPEQVRAAIRGLGAGARRLAERTLAA